jgi:hypothetical protein
VFVCFPNKAAAAVVYIFIFLTRPLLLFYLYFPNKTDSPVFISVFLTRLLLPFVFLFT